MRNGIAIVGLVLTLAYGGCSVPLLSQSPSGQAANDVRIGCLLSLQNWEWRAIDSPILTIEIENTSDDDVKLDASASLTLMPNVVSNEQEVGGYWAPVDIRNDSPAEMNKHPHIRIAKHSKRKLDIHPADMKWKRQISSVWPNEALFSVVSEGQYTLQFSTHSDKGEIISNTATITIRKS